MTITVKNVSRSFGTFKAVDNVSITIPSGQLVALLGPSGSGKTTLLRIIAGIEQPDPTGNCSVFFKDIDMASTHPRDRGVGFVFQHYALFKHMTVFENIAFGLRIKPKVSRPSRETITKRVNELLHLVQLEGMGHRYPDQLSGGQRQRVALARALAVEPQVLLLDEPFGALDARVRKELRSWLRRLHDELQMTSVFVTHDQEEALEVADIVVIMNHGRIEQIGSPHEVFHHPANEFVMRFLGEVNAFTGRMKGDSVELLNSIQIPLHSEIQSSVIQSEGEASIFIRPHDLTIDLSPSDQPSIAATVLQIHSAGPIVRVHLKTTAGESLSAELSQTRFQTMKLQTGSNVFVRPRHIKVFAANA